MPHTTPFEVESASEAQGARLKLSGELDIATVPRVEDAVAATLKGGVDTLTIDLSGLSFVDSSGLRMLIVLDQRAASEGWQLRLIRPGRQALTVFRISGVEENLPFVEDAGAA